MTRGYTKSFLVFARRVSCRVGRDHLGRIFCYRRGCDC